MNYFSYIQDKIISQEQLKQKLPYWNFCQKKIVFTNGCFDILHRGHVEYLAKAAELGNILVIGLNTDTSVKKLKGENRPIQDEYSRAFLLAALQFVSNVVLFEEETPYELIKLLQPDVLVKGKDYAIEQIAGHDIVQAKGGQVITIELTSGFSTTGILKRIS